MKKTKLFKILTISFAFFIFFGCDPEPDDTESFLYIKVSNGTSISTRSIYVVVSSSPGFEDESILKKTPMTGDTILFDDLGTATVYIGIFADSNQNSEPDSGEYGILFQNVQWGGEPRAVELFIGEEEDVALALNLTDIIP